MKILLYLTILTILTGALFSVSGEAQFIASGECQNSTLVKDSHNHVDEKECDHGQKEETNTAHCDKHIKHCSLICSAISFEDKTLLASKASYHLKNVFSYTIHYSINFSNTIYRPPIS